MRRTPTALNAYPTDRALWPATGRGLLLGLAILAGIGTQLLLLPTLGTGAIIPALLVTVPPALWLLGRRPDPIAPPAEEPARVLADNEPDTTMLELLGTEALIAERGSIRWISPALAQASDHEPESLVGRDAVHALFAHATDPGSVLDLLRALRDGHTYDGRLRSIPGGSSEPRALDIRIRPINQDGRCLLVARDATRASIESDRAQCLRAAMDEIADMVFWLSPAGTVLGVNDSVRRRLGVCGPDIIGQPLNDHFPELQTSTLTGGGHAIDTTCLDQNGRSIPVEVVVRAMDGTDSIGWMIIAHDHSDKKEWETAARLSDARSRRAVENSEEGVWECSATLETAWFSDRFKSMLGHAPEEISNRVEELSDRLHPDDRDAVLSQLHDHIERARPFDLECRLRLRGGEHRWFRIHTKSIRDDHGRPIRIMGSLVDINQRKLLEAEVTRLRSELIHAKRWSNDVTDQMGHALRTPLSALMACAETLEQANSDIDTLAQRNMLRKIQEHARRLQANVDGLLTICQDRSTMDISVQSVVARAFLDAAVRPTREMAERQHVGFDLRIDPAIPHLIETDPARVSQLLTGVLTTLVNAGENGRISTEIQAADTGTALHVHTTLERATRAPITATNLRDAANGWSATPLEETGGIRLARKIARRLGGELELQRQGTTVSIQIVLPLGTPAIHASTQRLQAA